MVTPRNVTFATPAVILSADGSSDTTFSWNLPGNLGGKQVTVTLHNMPLDRLPAFRSILREYIKRHEAGLQNIQAQAVSAPVAALSGTVVVLDLEQVEV